MPQDLDQIEAIETSVFDCDRLSRRSLRAFITSKTACLLVYARRGEILGYSLMGFRKGSERARLYSIAVAPGLSGIGRRLLSASEKAARERGCTALRLEVRADNFRAKNLYEKNRYLYFEAVTDYYEDGATALRFEKNIRRK